MASELVTFEELADALEDVTFQATVCSEDALMDSEGLTPYERAIELLVKLGRADAVPGGRIRARLRPQGRKGTER